MDSPRAQAVGDGDSLILRQIVAVYLLRFFHVSTIPVDERALVAAGRPSAPVPPNLRSLRDTDSLGGLREVHAAGDELDVPGPARLLHLPQLFVDDSVEFVSHQKTPFPIKGCCNVRQNPPARWRQPGEVAPRFLGRLAFVVAHRHIDNEADVAFNRAEAVEGGVVCR